MTTLKINPNFISKIIFRILLVSFLVSTSLVSSLDAKKRLFGTKAIKLRNGQSFSSQTCELYNPGFPLIAHIRRGDSLSFSYGVSKKILSQDDSRYKFMVLVSEGDGVPLTIFTDTLHPSENSESSGWKNEEVALSIFSRKKVTIQFLSQKIDPTGMMVKLDPASALWGGVRLGNFVRKKREMNIILISLDTLRADHLGIEGYFRDTSPNIDALAKQGVYFKEAIATAPWTLPSHRAIFTGLFPSFQKAVVKKEQRPMEMLPPEKRMLTEFLYLNGYVTQAFTAGGYVAAQWGFFRGFDRYVEVRRKNTKNASSLFPRATMWIEAQRDKKFFLFLHTFDIHAPYQQRYFLKGLDQPSKVEGAVARYDSGIRYVDKFIGQLKEKLDELGLTENTILILTSDHGEELWQRDNPHSHGHTLYDDLLRIPLLFYCPSKFKPRLISGMQVQSTDIMPTILDLIGVTPPKSVQGKSLKRYLLGRAVPKKSIAFSEVSFTGHFRQSIRMLTPRGKFKFILTPSMSHSGYSTENNSEPEYPFEKTIKSTAGREFYDLEKDPGELSPLLPNENQSFSQMEVELNKFFPNVNSLPQKKNESLPIDDDLKEQLKALGY